jgi:hypothetical protein
MRTELMCALNLNKPIAVLLEEGAKYPKELDGVDVVATRTFNRSDMESLKKLAVEMVQEVILQMEENTEKGNG